YKSQVQVLDENWYGAELFSREDGQPSIRPNPNDCPEWAAKNKDDNVDGSAQSLILVALH
ncbi:Hypothetical predicted protein, partial [Paramuricea clavata]